MLGWVGLGSGDVTNFWDRRVIHRILSALGRLFHSGYNSFSDIARSRRVCYSSNLRLSNLMKLLTGSFQT
jgi:hypothetical protein